MTARPRMMMMLLPLLLPLLALPGAVNAQRSTLAVAAPAELDSATTAGVLHEVERATARGLPAAPLLAKAREGRLKRAPGPRIRQAVSALAVRLDSARVALGPDATADELVSAADALAAGVGPDALRMVRAASTVRSLNAPLGALAQLVASGVSPRRATAMIVDLLRRRVAPAQVVAFGNAVQFDAAGGLPADEAALFRLRAVNGAAGVSLSDMVSAPSTPANVTAPPPPSATAPPRRRP